jgi:hypothetical protein
MIASRMFAVPAFPLLSVIRRDPFAVSSTTLWASANPEFPLPASVLSFRQKSGRAKSAKPHESCQVLQNEHLQKSSHNSREMNTYTKRGRGEGAITLGRIGVTSVIPLDSHRCASLQRNSHGMISLTKKVGGGGPLDLGSDPFAIARDRAMINVP